MVTSAVYLAAVSARALPLLIFVPVAALVLLGAWLLGNSSARQGAIEGRGGYVPARFGAGERFDHWVAKTRRGADLNARLRSAGSTLTAGRFVLGTAAAAVTALILVGLLLPFLLAIVAAAFAVWACFGWLERRLQKRKELFVAQLPEIARLLSNGGAAGLSVPASLELTVREIAEPAHGELQVVLDQLALGQSLEDALSDLGERLPSRELSVLLTTLIIQQRAGGDVVHALTELSATLDERRQTLREVSTLLAGAVYTSYLVPLLGVGALLLLNTVNSQTLHDMTSRPLGLITLAVSALLYLLGWFAIRAVTRIQL
jgi:tight adherence protein B